MYKQDGTRLQSIGVVKYVLAELFTRAEYDAIRSTYSLPTLDTAARRGIIYPAAWEPYTGCDKDGCTYEGKRYFYRLAEY